MTNFRERAAEVKAAGEEARGDFTPNGVPKRMYQWWLEYSPSDKAQKISTGARRENFCHFWRVVVIWVPLLWLGLKILGPIEYAVDNVSPKTALVACGLLVAGTAALIATTTGTWMQLLLTLAWILGIAAVAAAIAFLFFWLNEKTENGVEWLFGIMLGIAVLIFLGALIADFGLWSVLMWAAIGAVGVGALIVGIIGIGSLLENLRADAKKRHTAAMEDAWNAYTAGEGPNPYERTPRKPSAIEKFFSGVGDFLTLIAQVVRVNKWKICPLVEVDAPVRQSRSMPGAPHWDGPDDF